MRASRGPVSTQAVARAHEIGHVAVSTSRRPLLAHAAVFALPLLLLTACSGSARPSAGESEAPPSAASAPQAAENAGSPAAVPAQAPAAAPTLSPAAAALRERFGRMSVQAEERGLAEPFRGITLGGELRTGLFPLRSTGVSTAPVRFAAEAFLAALTPEQRERTTFPVEDQEWRKWMNQHFYLRDGVSFEEMSEAQREAAFGLMRASLSAKGMRTSRDIMRLNHTLAEINDDFDQYGEWLYNITVMGSPSATEPWGWQLDGHHLIVNYFVLGDQVVMTPTFMGSEPVTATSGRYAGTTILQDEQDLGLALISSLDAAQRAQAIVKVSREGNENVSEAFRDNLDLDYIGINALGLTGTQRERLLELIGSYVANLPEGHARVRLVEVMAHFSDTWFAWIGGTDATSAFYYRIQSPVILIEFDHQSPVAMPGLPRGVPTRQHIHTVVRTPNGNDYGKDLLRQHHQQHSH